MIHPHYCVLAPYIAKGNRLMSLLLLYLTLQYWESHPIVPSMLDKHHPNASPTVVLEASHSSSLVHNIRRKATERR